jgi:two-component system response regulator YesN
MITVMLVEDEVWIRYLIKSLVDWNELGFEIVGEASDGTDALSLIRDIQPQIVLTDIKMPEMDGIELMTAVKKVFPHTEFVMISGYDSFDYAQKSLNLGAAAYLLKPVDKKQLVEVLIKIKTKMEELNSIREIRFKNIHMLKEQLFINLLNEEKYSTDELVLQRKQK